MAKAATCSNREHDEHCNCQLCGYECPSSDCELSVALRSSVLQLAAGQPFPAVAEAVIPLVLLQVLQ